MESALTEPEDDDHAYFLAIEEIFTRLRGSPLLLSPADWQVARRWHRGGVPLDLVGNALEEVFARRRERGAKGKISSLRYCAPAVEAAWSHLRELTAPGERSAVAALDVPARLAALAAALPGDLPGRDALAARLAALTETAGGTETVERRLAELDRELLDDADWRASARLAKEVDQTVDATLAALSGRLPAEELARSRDRLRRQLLRQRLKLPVLSLFSPAAEPP